MSLAPRRPLARLLSFLVLVSLSWTHRAAAQAAAPSPSRRVIVLVVLPSAAQLDAPRLRVDIGEELGADVVALGDPLAPSAVGTLTVGLDASSGAGRVTVRYEARAEPISRQMDFPRTPGAAEQAVVLLAGNLARDESAELALAVCERRVSKVVAAAEVRPVEYRSAPVETRSDAPRSTVRFGVGAEPVLWYVPADTTTSLGARVFGRMNVEISPLVAFHVDLGIGVLQGVSSSDTVAAGIDTIRQATTSIPISVRADLQLNIARHYSVGLGIDLGVDISRTSSEQVSVLDPNGPGGTATGATEFVGFHVSPVTLRFGRANKFQFAAQEGVLYLPDEGNAALEQTVSFTYLFGVALGALSGLVDGIRTFSLGC